MAFKLLPSATCVFVIATALTAYDASSMQKEYGAVLQSRPYRAHGEQLFVTCANCHGADGGGVPDGRVPAIAGQQFAYLLRQMHDAVEGRRPSFSREHVRILARFDRADYVGTADYLARLGR